MKENCLGVLMFTPTEEGFLQPMLRDIAQTKKTLIVDAVRVPSEMGDPAALQTIKDEFDRHKPFAILICSGHHWAIYAAEMAYRMNVRTVVVLMDTMKDSLVATLYADRVIVKDREMFDKVQAINSIRRATKPIVHIIGSDINRIPVHLLDEMKGIQ